ncbi:MAG: hypothetical protein ACI9MS_002476 [Glaciecola sp.]|jgi:hypothetical protein
MIRPSIQQNRQFNPVTPTCWRASILSPRVFLIGCTTSSVLLRGQKMKTHRIFCINQHRAKRREADF